jgi:hypothetical protein
MKSEEPRRIYKPPQNLRGNFEALCDALKLDPRFINAALANATVNAAKVDDVIVKVNAAANAAATEATATKSAAATEATATESTATEATDCQISERNAIGLIGLAILSQRFLEGLQAMTDMTKVMEHFKMLENLLEKYVPGLDMSNIPFELDEIAKAGAMAKQLCEFMKSCKVSGDFIEGMSQEHLDGIKRAAELHNAMLKEFEFLEPDYDVSAKLFSYNFRDRIEGYRKLCKLYERICIQRYSHKVSASKPEYGKLQIVKLFERQTDKASGSSC